MLDVLIRGATLYDGTGGPPRAADVAVRGDRIERVGVAPGAGANVEIEASGLLIEQTQHDTFAVAGRHGRNAHVDRTPRDAQ